MEGREQDMCGLDIRRTPGLEKGNGMQGYHLHAAEVHQGIPFVLPSRGCPELLHRTSLITIMLQRACDGESQLQSVCQLCVRAQLRDAS